MPNGSEYRHIIESCCTSHTLPVEKVVSLFSMWYFSAMWTNKKNSTFVVLGWVGFVYFVVNQNIAFYGQIVSRGNWKKTRFKMLYFEIMKTVRNLFTMLLCRFWIDIVYDGWHFSILNTNFTARIRKKVPNFNIGQKSIC